MKKALIATVALMAAGAVQADVFAITFGSSFGIYGETGTAGIYPNDGDQGLIQLVYAGANGVADYDAPNTLSLESLVVGSGAGDDIVLWETIWTANGSSGDFSDFASGTYGNIIAPYLGTGVVYGRIFTGTGKAGDKWYEGALQAMGDKPSDPPPTPELYDLGGGADLQMVDGATVVIPEPATFGLMGVAALGMFLARKQARR